MSGGELAQLAGVAALTVAGSFVTGFLGAGGGIVAVPLLLYVLPLFAPALPGIHQVSALAAIQALFSSIGATAHYATTGDLRVRRVSGLGAVLGVTSLAGGLLSAILPPQLLLAIFCVLTSGGAVSLLVRPRSARKPASRTVVAAALAVLGLLGGAIGVGTGPLVIAVLLHASRLPMYEAKSTAVTLILFTVVPAVVGKASTGQVLWVDAAVVAAVTLAVSALGSLLSRRASPTLLRVSLLAITAAISVRSWVDLVVGR